ncbi:hypothetical protein KC669_01175 [Candidatus Dojkabacteria bacterium]|uniref:Uncharacterized protein n=1 Tax=Candidatus Dojkabacteria bacterium TaxID=2099670 RepID=A0A955LAL7_9BACT|nr:hypothetical protein [Candidatus Dojkabacteria bacterium]
MKAINVTKKDLLEYRFTSSRENKIRLFWLYILKSMPDSLKIEVRKKQTDLKKVSQNTFMFRTLDSTNELTDYLSQFKVNVENFDFEFQLNNVYSF